MNLKARARWGTLIVLAYAVVAYAGGKDKPKDTPGSHVVDSGAFGVLVKGQRVLTETFTVRQENGVSVVTAAIKEAAGQAPSEQKSMLEFDPKGELLRYDWSQSGASTGSLTVVPNNEFLTEKTTAPGSSKPAEQAFLMPASTIILDNNFFVHREVLAWRYLAEQCHQEQGSMKCRKEPGEYGVLVPQDRSSQRVRIELVGQEKVTVRGAERDLMRLNLHGDGYDWALWVDGLNQFKLMKVAIPADNTEVERD